MNRAPTPSFLKSHLFKMWQLPFSGNQAQTIQKIITWISQDSAIDTICGDILGGSCNTQQSLLRFRNVIPAAIDHTYPCQQTAITEMAQVKKIPTLRMTVHDLKYKGHLYNTTLAVPSVGNSLCLAGFVERICSSKRLLSFTTHTVIMECFGTYRIIWKQYMKVQFCCSCL